MTTYPAAERLDLVEDLHGHAVADPYRWLEDAADPRTREWAAAQEALVRAHLDGLPGRERLRARLTALLAAGAAGVPVWRDGTGFSTRRGPGQEHAVLLRHDVDGRSRVLLDVGALDPTGATTLDAWAPSKEGRLLAYQLSVGGDEESLLHVVEVETGRLVDGPLDRCRYSPVAWVPGGQAFYYVRRLPPEDVPAGEEQFHRRVWRHVVGTPTSQDVLVPCAGYDEPTNYYGCSVSRDGRWLVVSASAGTAPRDDVWLYDLSVPDAPPAQVQVGVDARLSAWVGRDGRLWLLTDRDAPRGRLCVADPTAPQDWTELVAEDPEAVLEDVEQLVDGRLVVLRSRHAVSEVEVDGVPLELPGLGSVGGLSGLPEGGHEVWFGLTGTTTPQTVHRYDARTGDLSVWATPPGAVDLPAVSTRLVEVTSKDGTTVRALVVSPAAEPDRPRPTVLYGYGGFGVSLSPAFTSNALAWVEAGGVWVVANLRGGSEEGEQWHRAGMRGQKQNVFDDFAAVADALVVQGWTTPGQLGIYGGSNGGLLGYSPYHRVVEGARYPAVLFTVFDGDSRVDPLHARKLCAALQHATSSEAPVLLRDEKDVGHGARSVSRTVGLSVDLLAFLAHHTGLEL